MGLYYWNYNSQIPQQLALSPTLFCKKTLKEIETIKHVRSDNQVG